MIQMNPKEEMCFLVVDEQVVAHSLEISIRFDWINRLNVPFVLSRLLEERYKPNLVKILLQNSAKHRKM
jgi:hypothetical protein